MILNDKQRAFADYYLETGNAYQSALKAGYSKNYAKASGKLMLESKGVKTYLAERRKELEDSRVCTIREMQIHLTDIIRRTVEEDVIVVQPVGEGYSDIVHVKKKPSNKDVLTAVNTLGKMLGAFDNTITVASAIPVVIVDDVPEDDDEE